MPFDPIVVSNDQSALEDLFARPGATSGAKLDSTTASGLVLTDFKNASGTNAPVILDGLLGKCKSKDDEQRLMKAFFDGATLYEREHGRTVDGGVLYNAALHAYTMFDSASVANVTTAHHNQISMVPSAPMVAVMYMLAEACPFAAYVPGNPANNEVPLIIVQHQSATDWGAYKAGDSMDGTAAGGACLRSERTMELSAPNDGANYKFIFRAVAKDAGSAPLILLRGRTQVFVNGVLAFNEDVRINNLIPTVPLSGSATINGTDFVINGTVKPAIGEVSLVPGQALPPNTTITVIAYIDYEADGVLPGRMALAANKFVLYASPSRGAYTMSPDARQQFSAEIGVEPGGEAMMAIRSQLANERHVSALNKAYMVGRFNRPVTYDFALPAQILQKTRAQMIQDFSALLSALSQAMAEDTIDHGITDLYVTKSMLALFQTMDSTLFMPSGVSVRPGIYRAGRLFGLYDVYYTPYVLQETPDCKAAEVLCIGRSTQAARNPIIFGDVQGLEFSPLGIAQDAKTGYVCTSRDITANNPHPQSAKAAILITVTNLK